MPSDRAATTTAQEGAATTGLAPDETGPLAPGAPVDVDELATNQLDPLVPRPIDLPTELPLHEPLAADVGDIAKIFAAPEDPADWPAWRSALDRWRADARERLDYDGSIYDRAETRWTSSCYSVALVWLWDERLFDRDRGRFDVAAFLAGTSDHGGFDGVVLWHAYPVIGIDDRNQFDYYRDVPGLPDVVAAFQAAGVRVFVDYNPWDTGTRRADHDDAAELALLVSELGVDGVFLDTMKEGDRTLVDALLAADPPQVLEGESRVPNARVEDHQLSWAQWFADSPAPGVMRAHWYERRHMMHSTRRWNRDHSDELQSAFMNGTGMLVWDTVFGVWVGWNERDKATLRRMLRVQRALSDVLVAGRWVPLADATPDALARSVHVSRFEGAGAQEGLTLWTIVNRSDSDYDGPVLRPFHDGADAPPPAPTHWLDLGVGARLDGLDASGALSLTVPARGVTAVLSIGGAEHTVPGRIEALLHEAAADPGSADSTFPARETRRLRPAPSRAAAPDPGAVVTVPEGRWTLPVATRRRETGLYGEAPYVEEWKPLPPRLHDPMTLQVEIETGPVQVARREVTASEFAGFVAATGYRPETPERFAPRPAGDGPAVLVDLDDARAYAGWVGARLPTEFEWQLAAADPAFERSEPLVWNWTESEHDDGVTRFSLLKGGSAHETTGSDWYTDGGPREPAFSLKLLRTGSGLERSPSIGFRLAWDAPATGAPS